MCRLNIVVAYLLYNKSMHFYPLNLKARRFYEEKQHCQKTFCGTLKTVV